MVLFHSTKDGRLLIKIQGDINKFDVPVIRKMFEDFITFHEITFDMSKVSFFDSAFLHFLLEIKDEGSGRPRNIQLLHPNEYIYETLVLMNMDKVFKVIFGKTVRPEGGISQKTGKIKAGSLT